jgi:hypothetical protein
MKCHIRSAIWVEDKVLCVDDEMFLQQFRIRKRITSKPDTTHVLLFTQRESLAQSNGDILKQLRNLCPFNILRINSIQGLKSHAHLYNADAQVTNLKVFTKLFK